MPYSERYRASSEIFENVHFLKVDEHLDLTPIKPEIIDLEATIYLINSKDEDVKKYLPGAYVSNANEANEKLQDFIKRMLFKNAILFCIRPKKQPVPLGYILLHSPLANTGLDTWSIDFWLFKEFRGQNIMRASIYRVLQHMQDMRIDIVSAIVDKENLPSVNLLESVGFSKLSVEEGGLRYVFGMKLND